MNKAHYRYILLEQGVGTVVMNILINGAIAWLFFRSFSITINECITESRKDNKCITLTFE